MGKAEAKGLSLSMETLEVEAKEREARIYEAAGASIGRLSDDVAATAYTDGLIVRVHFSWWRGQSALRPEDLGMAPTKKVKEFLNEAVNFGNKRLLPRAIISRLKSLEVQGRTALAALSFDTLFGHFVPLTTYPLWKERFSKIQADFYTCRDELVGKHEEVKQEVRTLWVENAPRLYRMVNGKAPPTGYANEVAERVVLQIRSPELIMEHFACEQSVNIVPIPSAAQLDKLKQEQVQRLVRLGKERADLVNDYEADIGQVYGQRKKQMTDFVGSIQDQISATICQFATEVHNTVNGKTMTDRTGNKLRRLLGEARALNFVDDPAATAWLDKIEETLDDSKLVSAEEHTAALAKVLARVSTEAKEGLSEARQSDVSFGLVFNLPKKPRKK